jgi:hypothetical protein
LTLTPVLTLEEALLFSANCAIDDGNTNNEVRGSARDRAFLRLAGLSLMSQTLLLAGNAEIRGVSREVRNVVSR